MTELDERLQHERKLLLLALNNLARAEGMSVTNACSERDLNLCERLLDERIGNRSINIDLWEPGDGTDFFFKSVGFDDEVDLLTIFVDDHLSIPPETLWQAYRAWMHDEASSAAVERILDRYGPE